MTGPGRVVASVARLAGVVVLVVLTLAPVPSRAATAACDLFSRSGFFDDLSVTNTADLDPSTNETDVGTVGTLSIESAARQPGTGTLFAADYDQIGTVDPATAAWSPAPGTLGSGNGSLGVRAFADTRGLAFDPATGDLYAVVVSTEPELLIRVDPIGGAAVPDAFGPGQDYRVLSLSAPYGAADTFGEIAIHAGAWYGLVDHAGGTDLVSLDPGTGVVTKIGTIAPNVTGLDFDDGGQAWVISGGGTLSQVDTSTAALSASRPVDNASNYRSLACIGSGGGNTPPVANPDAVGTGEDGPVVIDPLANDSDADLDPLSLASFTQPANGTVVDLGDDTVRYTPDQHFNGVDTFDYTVTDGTGSDTSTVTVTVSPAPDPPVVDPVADQSVAEGTPFTLTVTASDPDGDPLTLTAAGLPAWVAFVDNGDGTADLSGTPGYTDAATSTVTITADDGSLTHDAVFDLTVTNTNRPPAADPIADQTTAEGDPFTLTVTASDPDGDPLTLTAAGLPPWLTLSSGGMLTGTPGYADAGTSVVTVTADDGTVTGRTSFELTVTHVNRPPRAEDDEVGSITGPVDIEVTANDADPDGDLLAIAGVGDPAGGRLVLLGGGQVRYVPLAGHTGPDTFTYTITDGAAVATATVRLTVAAAASAQDDGGAAEVLVPGGPTPEPAGGSGPGSPAPPAAPLVGSPAPTGSQDGDTDRAHSTARLQDGSAAPSSAGPATSAPDVAGSASTAGGTAATATPLAALRASLQVSHAEASGNDWAQPLPALSPRAGLMVAFRAAVETLRDHALAAVLLGVVIAWMALRAIDRNGAGDAEPA